MSPSDEASRPPSRLDRIATQWSLIHRAHGSEGSLVRDARNDLVMRYSTAIRRYMRAITRDDESADELAQEAVVRMLRGDFSGAAPERGRFRDFLKTVVRNMVRNHWSRENRRRGVDFDTAELPEEESPNDTWLELWRNNVLDLAWSALRREQDRDPDNLDHTLLELRVEHPDATSDELAVKLGQTLGRPVRADALRQKLRRARRRFADRLLAEIASGLPNPCVEDIEQELVDLELYQRVQPLLPSDWREKV